MTNHNNKKAPAANPDRAKSSVGRRLKGKVTPGKTTKIDALVLLLSRGKGATIDDMMKATGWQAHSVRGFIAGTLKKKLGRKVTSEKTDEGRVYRLSLAGDAE